jgi:hypothetical protein
MTRDDMTDLRKAAEMALGALESCDAQHASDGGRQYFDDRLVEPAVIALRAALDKHKKRMAREKKRVKPRVPPWMMQP